VTGAIVFAVTYVLVSARRLSWLPFDRPAAALLGAVAIVLLRVLTPHEALAAIDAPTLVLLFGVMGMGAFLALDDVFARIEGALVRRCPTPSRLLAGVVWGTGGLAALITNDAACVFLVPVVVRIIKRHELPALPYLLALACASNVGSVATLVGNPQNMLCASLGDLSYRDHLVLLAPVAVMGLAVVHAILWLAFRDEMAERTLAPPPPEGPLPRRTIATLAVIAATALALVFGTDLPWTATSGFVAMMLLHRRDTRPLWGHIDWSLILFFAGLFVVVEGLVQSGLPARAFAAFPLWTAGSEVFAWARLSVIFLVGSNVVSNVPFIMVVREPIAALPDPKLGWEMLAMASTFAGNLTLLGSVANIIVAESARRVGGLGFVQHLRVGLPVALITTAMGAGWIALFGGWILD